LRRALASAAAQTFPNLEILVSDNASTDPAVPEILAEFARLDPRFTIHRQPRNLGPTENFNFVLQRARGAFFMWLADDDWLDPHAVRLLHDALARQPEISGVNGGVKYYSQEKVEYSFPGQAVSGGTPAARVLSYCRHVSHNSIIYGLYRQSAISGIVMTNELANDWLFMAKVVARGPFAAIPEFTVHRSLGGTSENIERIFKDLNLAGPAPANPHRGYAAIMFKGLLRDRAQLPGMGWPQVAWLGLLAWTVFWIRGTVPASLRASVKRGLSWRPFPPRPNPGPTR
jgi:glycosyltransferase involved in cell wall biosynthesis